MLRWWLVAVVLLAPVRAQLPDAYRVFERARDTGDAGALEALLDAPGYVQILAARTLSRSPELSPSRRLELAERAARFENAAGDWLWVGRLREVLGDAPGAAQAYGRAVPLPEAEAALVRLAAAGVRETYAALYRGGAYEALLEVLPASEVAWRARALDRLHRSSEALAAYRAWAKASEQGRRALGRALLRMGRYREAEAVFRGVRGPEGAYGRGRALEALGRTAEALRAYRASGLPEALWRATTLLERAGKAAAALPLYRELAQGDSRYADDAVLRMWVLARRRGDAGLEAWAYARLQGGLATLAGRPPGPLPACERTPSTPVAGSVRDLVRAGRERWAAGEARWWFTRERAGERRLALLDALYDAGLWGEGMRLARALSFRWEGCLLQRTHPRAYPGRVRREAARFGIEPELLWAVMRVESRFDPRAVSPTGARGLMQFTAATWADVARRLGEAPGDPFDPATAVRYGAYYLRWLLDRCEGGLVCALASYNGGPGYTRRALATESGDVWDFLRFQPRDEPREYVERVVRAYAVYKSLYRAGR